MSENLEQPQPLRPFGKEPHAASMRGRGGAAGKRGTGGRRNTAISCR